MKELYDWCPLPILRDLLLLMFRAAFEGQTAEAVLTSWKFCEVDKVTFFERTDAMKTLATHVQDSPLRTTIMLLDFKSAAVTTAVLGSYLKTFPARAIPDKCESQSLVCHRTKNNHLIN